MIHQLDIEREKQVYAEEQAFKVERSCQEYQLKALVMEKELGTHRVKQKLRIQKSVIFKSEAIKLLNEKQKEVFALESRTKKESRSNGLASNAETKRMLWKTSLI